MSINRVNISGNLTRDPELRATAGGTQVLSFGVAVNDRRRNAQTGEWEDYPNFVDCTMFGQDLAANVRSTSSLIGHDALRGGNDCGAQALHDLRHILAVGVDAQAGLGNTAQAGDDGLAICLILQGDNDGALDGIVLDLHTLDVALVNQNLADRLLHVRCGDLHRRVFGSASVADASQQVRDRISNLHLPLTSLD